MTAMTDLQGRYTIDAAHSTLGFVARHAMITKVRGSFTDFSGSADIDGDNPSNSSANVEIQVASIDTRNKDRDDHLKTGDFFELDTYPTISFTSTGVEVTGDDTVDVTGDLTIKDVTQSVTIPFEYTGAATDPFGNERVGFEGELTVNRSDFGLTFNAALETGGVLIGEKIKLELAVSAIKDA